MKKTLFFIINILILITCEAKQPDISAKDVKIKVCEILEAHASFDDINDEVMKRTLANFVNELDPQKTYFIESEIASYVDAPKQLSSKALGFYSHSDFTLFNEIYTLYLKAIERRGKIEEIISSKPLIQEVDSKKFKNLDWVKTEEELCQRLLEIRSLQTQSSSKLDDTSSEQVLKYLEKRRHNHEEEFLNNKEKKKHIYALFLKAIASSFDGHTNYFTPNEANQFMIHVQQRLFGIGAQLRDTLNGFTIVRIIEGGPCDLSKKFKINDRIIAVDHEPIIGMDIAEGVEKIRGEKGTPVTLTVRREHSEGNTETFEIKLTRNEVVIEESRLKTSFTPYAEGIIGYLKLYSFYQDQNTSSSLDIKKTIEEWQKDHKIKGIILDLRGNTGGLLSEAVSVAGHFIHQGIVVSVKDNTGSIQHLREINSKCLYGGPLVVLTDVASASASEIVAQSLQDYKRAINVGDPFTFGKGTFQTLTLDAKSTGKIDPKGEYKVTRGKYYTVSGKSPQLVGVKADIEVPGIFSNMEIGEKFSKYPLPNDSIAPNFEDHLEDVPFLHRFQAKKLYTIDPQPILTEFTSHLPILKSNSYTRIKNDENYQTFLKAINDENYDHEAVDLFRKADFQKIEAENILKDLIFLYEREEKKAAS